MTFDDVRRFLLALPGVEETTSYGTPSLKLGRKMLTRLREDGDTLVLPDVESDERAMLIEAEPAVFYVTDHYRGWPMVLARLSAAEPAQVEPLLMRRWRAVAPKRLLAAYDAER